MQVDKGERKMQGPGRLGKRAEESASMKKDQQTEGGTYQD